MVVEPCLPCERDALPSGFPDDGGFELPDNMGQTSATFGTASHFRMNILFFVGLPHCVNVGLPHCDSPTVVRPIVYDPSVLTPSHFQFAGLFLIYNVIRTNSSLLRMIWSWNRVCHANVMPCRWVSLMTADLNCPIICDRRPQRLARRCISVSTFCLLWGCRNTLL